MGAINVLFAAALNTTTKSSSMTPSSTLPHFKGMNKCSDGNYTYEYRRGITLPKLHFAKEDFGNASN